MRVFSEKKLKNQHIDNCSMPVACSWALVFCKGHPWVSFTVFAQLPPLDSIISLCKDVFCVSFFKMISNVL